jgi:beta-N-acetylhexosaminidase
MRRITGCIILLLAISNVRGQVHDSLDIKIGQMILIGFPGTTADEKVIDEIARGKVGSIIIFEKNIPPKNSFVELKKIIWTYQKAAPIPLFITIDQEGGKVNRLKDKYGFPRSITAEAMGKSGSADSVRFYSEATACTLAGLGINVNFAPVVDVATNPANPVIVRHGRSFSANQDSVVWMAREVIAAHRRMGVLTVLKHFPGHGSSKNDTHLGIADVTDTWSELELKPYETLISEGLVNAVMTGHLVNKNLDSEGNPSTLSKPILEGVLRKKLGFNGVVFSDDMQMHAITKHYGLSEAVRRAIDAGVDIMCFSNNIAGSDTRTVDAVHTIIKDLVATGAISRQRIDESYRRIMRLKKFTIEDPSAFYAGEIAGYKARISDLEKEMVRMQAAAVTEPRKKKKRKKS